MMAETTTNQSHCTLCDWCGKAAVTSTFRTLYLDTEFENTSRFFECAECSEKSTAALMEEQSQRDHTEL